MSDYIHMRNLRPNRLVVDGEQNYHKWLKHKSMKTWQTAKKLYCREDNLEREKSTQSSAALFHSCLLELVNLTYRAFSSILTQ